jgi:hypothetical protein
MIAIIVGTSVPLPSAFPALTLVAWTLLRVKMLIVCVVVPEVTVVTFTGMFDGLVCIVAVGVLFTTTGVEGTAAVAATVGVTPAFAVGEATGVVPAVGVPLPVDVVAAGVGVAAGAEGGPFVGSLVFGSLANKVLISLTCGTVVKPLATMRVAVLPDKGRS